MGKVFINETSLTAIGDAIREKTGETALLSPAEMATAIAGIETGGEGLKEIVLSGDISSAFYSGRLSGFLNNYKDYIVTKDITKADSLFTSNSTATSFPIDLYFAYYGQATGGNSSIFKYCRAMVETGKIVNLCGYCGSIFEGCNKLKYVNLVNPQAGTISGARMFYQCYSLRTIPTEVLSKIYLPESNTAYSATIFNNGFYSCYCLDELVGLYPPDIKLDSTGNTFVSTFSNCQRLKDVIFATQEDGTPFVRNWCYQTLSLGGVGYGSNITTGGIGQAKRVNDEATYEALKNDPDWWSAGENYSRYNHDSAVRTINSLPDCSAAVTSTSTNTIAFTGGAGSATDGGAINTLTEQEIAVATAKGWTVVLA